MANGRNGTIYIGVASDLPKRIWEHRNGANGGFAKTYAVILSSGTRRMTASTWHGSA
jgi:putative endonuclease